MLASGNVHMMHHAQAVHCSLFNCMTRCKVQSTVQPYPSSCHSRGVSPPNTQSTLTQRVQTLACCKISLTCLGHGSFIAVLQLTWVQALPRLCGLEVTPAGTVCPSFKSPSACSSSCLLHSAKQLSREPAYRLLRVALQQRLSEWLANILK